MAITDQGILMTPSYGSLMNCKTYGKTKNVLQKKERFVSCQKKSARQDSDSCMCLGFFFFEYSLTKP